jgi:hypothetical protein
MILNIRQQIANNRGAATTTIDIWGFYNHLALDVIGETAFGSEFDMINGGNSEAGFLPVAIGDRMRFAALHVALPGLARWTVTAKTAMKSNDDLIKVRSPVPL